MLYRLPAGRLGNRRLLHHAVAAAMLHDFGQRFTEWRRFRRNIRRLAALDDRLLADIGVARAEIAARVRGDC